MSAHRLLSSLTVTLALAGAAVACNGKSSQTGRPGQDISRESILDTEDLARELELVVLDNYLQLAVGNIETYADSVARDREVMLVGPGPDDLFVGQNPSLERVDRRPLRKRVRCQDAARGTREVCVRALSKRLDIHLYADDSVGWLSDELSYRVPVQGREAAIPLRITAVFVRDIDLWVMVSEHMSYAVPIDEIVAMARAGKLAKPKHFATGYTDRGRARLLTSAVGKYLNATEAQRVKLAQAMARKREKVARRPEVPADRRDPKNEPVAEDAMISLYPNPWGEYHDASVFEQSSLARVFGDGAKVTVGKYRFDTAANKRAAWLIANLTVTLPGDSGAPIKIGLRGTFLYAFDELSGWNLMQSHISVPITDDELEARVFGPLPEIPDRPRITDDTAQDPGEVEGESAHQPEPMSAPKAPSQAAPVAAPGG